MRSYMLVQRPWVVAVTTGVPFGLLMGLSAKYLSSTNWIAALIGGAVTGLLFGLGMAYANHQQRRVLDAAGTDASTGMLRTAYRAAGRGPVPADPETRAAALRIATHQLSLLRRYQVLFFLIAVPGVLSIALNLISGWQWRDALSVGGPLVLGLSFYWRRQLRERIRLLSTEDSTA